MTIQPHMKSRAIFTGCFMFPVLMIAHYMGYDSPTVAGVVGGIAGGVSVILFPDPASRDRKK